MWTNIGDSYVKRYDYILMSQQSIYDIIFVDDVFPKSKMTGRELLKSIQCRQDEHHVLISGRKLIKKVSLDDVMQIKMISKRDINKLYMGKIISAVFEEMPKKIAKFSVKS